MMFKTLLVALAAVASVSALPFKGSRDLHTGVRVIGISVRSIEPEHVPEIVVRGEHAIVEKRAELPAEVAVKTNANKEVVPYNSKRDIQAVAEIEERDVDELEERDIDELEERDVDDLEERDVDDLEERDFEDFEERDVDLEERDEDEFEKRQQIYPEELPTKSNNGDVVPYKREEEEVPFHKRVIASEIAVRTNEHGEIVPY